MKQRVEAGVVLLTIHPLNYFGKFVSCLFNFRLYRSKFPDSKGRDASTELLCCSYHLNTLGSCAS